MIRVLAPFSSYGAYLTAWIVAHTNRFQAACADRPLTSWISHWGSGADDGWWLPKAYGGPFPFEDDGEVARRHSPQSYAHRIDTPLLLMHADEDAACAVEQSEQLFATLRVLGKEVELLRFPEEGHRIALWGTGSRCGAPRGAAAPRRPARGSHRVVRSPSSRSIEGDRPPREWSRPLNSRVRWRSTTSPPTTRSTSLR